MQEAEEEIITDQDFCSNLEVIATIADWVPYTGHTRGSSKLVFEHCGDLSAVKVAFR